MSNDLALVGAYSMANYGDQLYPQLLAALAREEAVQRQVEHFALLPGTLESGQVVRPLRDLPASRPERVLVGGGDLLRTDRRTVALDHLEVPSHERPRNLRHRLHAEVFVRRRMLPGPGPWLPLNGWRATTTVAASVGVHELPLDPSTNRAVQHLDYAWVRTSAAAERLGRAGLARDRLLVAPDVAFAINGLVDVAAVRARGEQLLAPHARRGPAVVLHVAPFHGWDHDRLVALINSLARHDVVLLPLGRYAGEHLLLQRAAQRTHADYVGELPVSDVTAILAAAGTVVTTSMHAAIIGTCLGTPVLVPDVEKTASAFSACPEPPELITGADADLPRLVGSVAGTRLPTTATGNARAVREAFRETWAVLNR